MEIRLSTTDLEEAAKQYIGKLGFDLNHSDVKVVISQTKIATVEITPKKEQTGKKETTAQEINTDLTMPAVEDTKEPADTDNLFNTE